MKNISEQKPPEGNSSYYRWPSEKEKPNRDFTPLPSETEKPDRRVQRIIAFVITLFDPKRLANFIRNPASEELREELEKKHKQ